MSKGAPPKGPPPKGPPPKGPPPKAPPPAKGSACPEFKPPDTCGVDQFRFFEGMNKPCLTPGMSKAKCPRFAMK